MALAQILAVASICCAFATLVCAWRVYQQGLVPLYPAFFSYLLSLAVVLAISSFTGVTSKFYIWVYIVAYPITWGVYGLMVRELYNQIFAAYPGIAMFGRWSVYLAIALAGSIAIISHLMTRGLLVTKSVILIPLEVAGRNIVFGFALSIMVLLILISRYPIQLHRNVLVNCLLFSALLVAEAGQLLAVHLTSLRHNGLLDVALMAFDTACFGVWGFLLSRQGARQIVHIHHHFSANQERRLLGQLDALNAIGARAIRK